jgi:uncharacterized protein YndB with AHSA1/START domain
MEHHAPDASIGDKIEKNVLLHASPDRVWQAVSDPSELGAWFGMKLAGNVAPGAKLRGTIVPTTVDPEVAKEQRAHEGQPFEMEIESVVPQQLLSFRWHPFAVDRDQDYTAEPTTLVSFELEPRRDGVMLTVTESGFARLPSERRADAFESNERGWTTQMRLIEKYLAAHPS